MIEFRKIGDRAEWLRWREAFLTASDVGAVAGVDPYKTALRVYAEKTGMVPALPETELMRRGRHFEGAALSYLKEERPEWTVGSLGAFVIDHDNGLAGTPDAVAVEADEEGDELRRINVQVKVVNPKTFEEWNGRPPLAYRLQTSAENYLIDADRGVLAVLVVSGWSARLEVFEVPRHRQAEEKILKLARAFRDNLRQGRRPAFDLARDAEIVRALYDPIPTDPPRDLSGDNFLAQLLVNRARLKAAIKEAEAEVTAIDTELIAKLQGADTAICDGHRITWREQFRKGFTVQPSTRRVLTVRSPKEDDE